jgi:hypothetical protein
VRVKGSPQYEPLSDPFKSPKPPRRLAKKLPQIINDDEITSVLDEWKLYSIDDIPFEWQVTADTAIDKKQQITHSDKPAAIDEYWAQVTSIKNAVGLSKYSCLGKLVRACLSLSHGNADLERSFSVNKQVVTADRVSLGQETIGALRVVKEAIRIHGNGQVSEIPVTHRMLQLARSAYSLYKQHLEKKKAEAEMKRRSTEQERNKLLEEEKALQQKKQDKAKRIQLHKELDKRQTEQSNILKAAECLLADAEKKLSDAVKSADMCQVSFASGLLEVGRKRIAEAHREMNDIAATDGCDVSTVGWLVWFINGTSAQKGY